MRLGMCAWCAWVCSISCVRSPGPGRCYCWPTIWQRRYGAWHDKYGRNVCKRCRLCRPPPQHLQGAAHALPTPGLAPAHKHRFGRKPCKTTRNAASGGIHLVLRLRSEAAKQATRALSHRSVLVLLKQHSSMQLIQILALREKPSKILSWIWALHVFGPFTQLLQRRWTQSAPREKTGGS